MARPRPDSHRASPAGRQGPVLAEDRGVSEALGFVLSFSVIVMSIGLIYTGGFTTLNDLQGGEQTENAIRAFTLVADSFEELEESQAPKRAGSLDLDIGASLTVLNESEITVRVNGPDWQRTLVTRSLDYEFEQDRVSYESGAVLRSTRGRSAMVVQPQIFCSPSTNTSVVSIITLTAPNDRSLAAGTITITGAKRSTTLLYPDTRGAGPSIENVTIGVTSVHENAWVQYFESEGTGWEALSGDRFVCESADQVFVRHTVIEIRLSI